MSALFQDYDFEGRLPVLLALAVLWVTTVHVINKYTAARAIAQTGVLPATNITITELYVYPIKSCRGVSVKAATLDDCGFVHDRRYMLIDTKTREFITARKFPKLSLIDTAIGTDGSITASVDGKQTVIPMKPELKGTVQSAVWDTGMKCGLLKDGKSSTFFSLFLDHPVTLVKLLPVTETPARLIPAKYDSSKGQKHVSFHDGFPFLAISQASLDYLNTKLQGIQVDFRRFRPNIVVQTTEKNVRPHYEDYWRDIAVSSATKTTEQQQAVTFNVNKPCSRCIMPAVDPDVGKLTKKLEPNRTLRAYRTGPKDTLYFGQNMIHTVQTGTVSVGDTVTVLTQANHPNIETGGRTQPGFAYKLLQKLIPFI